jgi:uncharacterized protein (TIGR02996 family)
LQSEEEFLKALAERPNDRALRLVFCDWLLERGDPRGEAMSLFEKGTLSGAERRRLEKLQEANARKWLGPLADAMVPESCRFAGGLLHTVRFIANLAPERYAQLTGEMRLATVQSLAIDPGRVAAQVAGFLADPVLGRVVSLATDIASLLGAERLAFAPQRLEVALWHPEEELVALAAFAPAHAATVLTIATVEFLNPAFAEELADAVVASGVLAGRKRFEVTARYATLEGVARWLAVAAGRVRGSSRDTLQRWAVTYAETRLGLEGDGFEDFIIDVDGEGDLSVGARIATAAAVLALLDGLGIRRVDVRSVPGGRVRKGELDALRAAVRRLTNLEEFRVGGVLQSP